MTATPLQPEGRGAFRADIQGLRAVAVALVVVFHLFPDRLSGGFVGVDVFFVISGFLITGLLVRRAEAAGGVDFTDFYIRRARRLLPAALGALAATGLAALWFLPDIQWQRLAREIVASALYFENYLLYFQGRDYLTAEAAPSPVQHYWSLSIEEQFYIVWPVAVALGLWAARQTGTSPRAVLLAGLGALAAVSLFHSIRVTPLDAGSYFMTGARVWELAAGGLLALALPAAGRLPPLLNALLKWLGLAAILWSAYAYSGDTLFPGWAALVPVGGTVLLLLPPPGAPSVLPGPEALLSLAPMQWLGGVSYSLYLWHWPVIIFALAAGGGAMTPLLAAICTAVMLVLAQLSKMFLEDPFRHPPEARRARSTAAVSGGFLSLAGAASAALFVLAPSAALPAAATASASGAAAHPGAAALRPGAPPIAEAAFIPALAAAEGDIPETYRIGCHTPAGEDAPRTCAFGAAEGEARLTVALVGDSHAAHWLPALRSWADGAGARVHVFTKSSCAFVRGVPFRAGRPYPSCARWNEAVLAELAALQPDLVVTGKFSSLFLSGLPEGTNQTEAVVGGLAAQWRALGERGIPVLAMTHTPRFAEGVPDCIAREGAAGACRIARGEAFPQPDHMTLAAARVEGARAADLNDWICGSAHCETVVGNVLVYRDAHHLTATYSRTLGPALGGRIEAALAETRAAQ